MHDAIRKFIVENFLFGDSSGEIPDDESLIDNNIVDSTGILELVAFIEEQYAIRVADSEIVPANFDSIANLCRFASNKAAATEST